MGFRHYEGTPRPQATTWDCPTCGAKNTTPLERGCPQCKAGADAKAASAAANLQVVGEPAPADPFEVWWRTAEEPLMQLTTKDLARRAFMAGRQLALGPGQPQEVPPYLTKALGTAGSEAAPAQGGWMVALTPPRTFEDEEIILQPSLVDARTQATIVAALAFYRDNRLAYGDAPGELTAMETTALLQKLTPPEDPA